jgi:methyl halide transferase
VGEPQRNWDERYQSGDLPWDSGIRSRELARVLEEYQIAPCRAVELGCGTGTNAVFLAEQGFEVTAFDLSPTAIKLAKRRAEAARVSMRLVLADLVHFDGDVEPFDFIFDRGCYHCTRQVDLAGYRRTLERLSRPGTRYLLFTGNANEQNEGPGPPRLHEHEIRADLEDLFEFEFLREIRFEDAGGLEGPLGWSCLLTRR